MPFRTVKSTLRDLGCRGVHLESYDRPCLVQTQGRVEYGASPHERIEHNALRVDARQLKQPAGQMTPQRSRPSQVVIPKIGVQLDAHEGIFRVGLTVDSHCLFARPAPSRKRDSERPVRHLLCQILDDEWWFAPAFHTQRCNDGGGCFPRREANRGRHASQCVRSHKLEQYVGSRLRHGVTWQTPPRRRPQRVFLGLWEAQKRIRRSRLAWSRDGGSLHIPSSPPDCPNFRQRGEGPSGLCRDDKRTAGHPTRAWGPAP